MGKLKILGAREGYGEPMTKKQGTTLRTITHNFNFWGDIP